jgi:hypothetical protein
MAIAAANGGVNQANNTTSVAVTVTIASGDTIVVACTTAGNATTISTITDDKSGGSNTYTFRKRVSNTDIGGGNIPMVELWTAVATGSATTVTITRAAGGGTDIGGAVQCYTGVGSINTTTFGELDGNDATPTVAMDAAAAGNFIVAGFTGRMDGVDTDGANGVLRQAAWLDGASDRQSTTLADREATGAVSTTVAVVGNGANIWAAASLELVAAGGNTTIEPGLGSVPFTGRVMQIGRHASNQIVIQKA